MRDLERRRSQFSPQLRKARSVVKTDKVGEGGVMTRIYRFIGVLFIIVFFSSTYTEALDWNEVSKQIHSSKKRVVAENLGGGDFVVAAGRWKTIASRTKYPKLALINTTYIFCSKRLMTCEEATANLYTPEDPSKDSSESFLNVFIMDYNIIDWSGDIVRAKHEAHVADIQLRISVKDGLAERSYRETMVRGSETADPNISQNWILE
ncbi:MAG TPA: hypothetical protein VLW47_02535 [Thermodesulfobacteriota bacterium]|nr:hypothetical protein [Thermodesulfobacteriota bacterium]